MKKARIAELKDNLSRYLDYVRAGGSVLVLDRQEPVARIVPLSEGADKGGTGRQRLARLEREGLIKRGKGGLPVWLGREPAKVRGSVLQDLLEERERGR